MSKRKPRLGSIYRCKKNLPDGQVIELPTWWIKYSRNGQVFRESSKSDDYAEDEKLLKRRLGEIATGRFQGLTPERMTISQLCELVIEDYRENGKRSLGEVEYRFEKHLKPKVGLVRAAEFGSIHIKRYIASRRSESASDATINREFSIVRRGFSLGLRADPPLVIRAPYIPKLEESNTREGFLEYDQYRTLLNALPRHLKAFLVVGYHVGARSGELRKIEWQQVDLAACEIRMAARQTKNKKPRTLPIYGEMKPWLEMQKAERDQKWPDCPWVFHYCGRPIGGHLKGWKEACKAAGLPDLLFHDLRRSAVRNMERAAIPRNVAMSISGHRTESVYRRHDIVSQQDLKLAAARMENHFVKLAEKCAQECAQTGATPGDLGRSAIQ